MKFQEFDMTLKHRKGQYNVVCDTLSRAVCAIYADSTSQWYTNLKTKVTNEPTKYPNFKIENDTLYKFISTRSSTEDGRFEWKIVVPDDKVKSLVEEEHAKLMHLGAEKIFERIRIKYYWPKMKLEIKNILAKCRECKQAKYPTTATVPPMGEQKNAYKPFQMIALDFISGFVRSTKGNSDLLVVLDVFSKHVRLFPVRKISGPLSAEIIKKEWFLRYGAPEVLNSDNAQTFLSVAFKNLLAQFNVHHFLNSRRHCQNNPVERVNRVILASIRTSCRDDHRKWDSQLAQIEYSLNNTKHASTGFSPFYVIHGFESIINGKDHQSDRQTTEPSTEQFLQERSNILGQIYESVIRTNQKQYEKYKKSYNSKHKTVPKVFEIGQNVYKKNFKLSSASDNYSAKLGPVYLPCKVIARRGATSYELQDEEGRNLGVFAAQDLIPG